jgi:TRAP-type C4-dicarboxylate transport system substrate-binding protein
MPGIRRLLRREPVALALAAYKIWRRLPPRQRKAMLKLARKHGPKLAAKAAQRRRKR